MDNIHGHQPLVMDLPAHATVAEAKGLLNLKLMPNLDMAMAMDTVMDMVLDTAVDTLTSEVTT